MRQLISSLTLCGLGLVTLAGCGGETTAPAAAAKPAEAISFELEGTWKGEMVIDEKAAEKVRPEIVDSLKGMQMEMTFRDNGTLKLVGETGGKPYTSENKWDFVGDEDNKITIATVGEDGTAKNHEFFVNSPTSFDMPLVIETAQVGAMRFTKTR